MCVMMATWHCYKQQVLTCQDAAGQCCPSMRLYPDQRKGFSLSCAQQTRNVGSDGGNIMNVSITLFCKVIHCMIGKGRMAGIAAAFQE